MDVINGSPVSTADGNEAMIKLIPSKPITGSIPPETAFIQAHASNTGTLQFSFGEAIGANHMVLAAGDKHPPITVKLNEEHIRVKGSAAGQKFTITW
jgi:hypothetical protein